jgi:hypothetical protein
MGLPNCVESAAAQPTDFKSSEADPRQSIAVMLLQLSVHRRRNKVSRSASAGPSRWSARQAALKTAVPASQHASTRLIRQLDLADPSAPVGEAEFKQLAELFQGPLATKTIEAIRATTRLADDQVSKATAAMAAEELSAQVEASAAEAVQSFSSCSLAINVRTRQGWCQFVVVGPVGYFGEEAVLGLLAVLPP